MAESLARSRSKGAPARENTLQPLQIKYYRRMKTRKVYPMTVAWKKAERGLPGSPITLRPLAGGAQVVPAEQTLDPADPNAKVTFHITPLGRGRVTPFQLEVLYEGRKVQEVLLAGRVVSQGWTWMLLMLAVMGPWLILKYVKDDPLATPEQTSRAVLESFFQENLAPYPELFRQYFPQGEDYLGDVGPEIAFAYSEFQRLTVLYPLAYYVMLGCVGLAFVSAWFHRDKKKRKTSVPIPYPRRAQPVDDDD